MTRDALRDLIYNLFTIIIAACIVLPIMGLSWLYARATGDSGDD